MLALALICLLAPVAESPRGRPNPQAQRNEVVAGTIAAVDANARTIRLQVASEPEPREFRLDESCDYLKNNSKSSLADLREGARAVLRVNSATGRVTRVRVGDPAAAKSAPAQENAAATAPVIKSAEEELNSSWSLKIAPAQRIQAVLEYAIRVESVVAAETLVYAPIPPDLPGQRVTKASLGPFASEVREKSDLKRRMFLVRVPGTPNQTGVKVDLQARYEAELYSRRLVKSRSALRPKDASSGLKSATAVPVLARSERASALARHGFIEPKSHTLASWAQKNELERRLNESQIDFARRVFEAVVQDFGYEWTPNMDWRVDAMCSRLKTDCGGMSLVFVSALRRAGIPARVLVGRWAKSSIPGERSGGEPYHQSHARAEFYADGVGWVPVDCALAAVYGKPDRIHDHFGIDHGDFFTWHVDPELILDTLHFGVERVTWINGAFPFWVKGHGPLVSPRSTQTWKVEARDP